MHLKCYIWCFRVDTTYQKRPGHTFGWAVTGGPESNDIIDKKIFVKLPHGNLSPKKIRRSNLLRRYFHKYKTLYTKLCTVRPVMLKRPESDRENILTMIFWDTLIEITFDNYLSLITQVHYARISCWLSKVEDVIERSTLPIKMRASPKRIALVYV